LSAADRAQTISLYMLSCPAPKVYVFILNGLKGEQASVYMAFQAWTAATNITISEMNDFESVNFKLLVICNSGMNVFYNGERGVRPFSLDLIRADTDGRPRR